MSMMTKLLSAILLTGAIASAQTPAASKVLITVDGVAITEKDVYTELMVATQGRFFTDVPPARREELQNKHIGDLITKEVIYADAKKVGILESKDYKKQYKIQQDILKQRFEQEEKRLQKDLAIKMWQKKLFNAVQVPEKTIKKYYKDNIGEYKNVEEAHARHILIKNVPANPAVGIIGVNADDEINKIIAELKPLKGEALKAKFIELAKVKSQGPSGKDGGDLGRFSRGRMVPAFEKEAFSMKVGTITPKPVKTQFGSHILYLDARYPAGTKTYKEVKLEIEQRLKMEKLNKEMPAKMEAMMKKAKIEKLF